MGLWDQIGFFGRPAGGGRVDPLVRTETGDPALRDFGGNLWTAQPGPAPAPAAPPTLAQAPNRAQAYQAAQAGQGPNPLTTLSALGQSAWAGISAPGRAARGEPVSNADVFATALDWGTAGAGMVAPEGAVGIFAGRRAATADPRMLRLAEHYQRQGVRPETIHTQTGWFQGVDEVWRHEIDDSQARLRSGPLPANPRIGDLVDHPQLWSAYRDLADTPLQFAEPDPDGAIAYWHPGNPDTPEHVRLSPTDPDLLTTALHEIQHGVQFREGFAPGGNGLTSVQEELAQNSYEDDLFSNQGAWEGFQRWADDPENSARYGHMSPFEILSLPESQQMIDHDPLLARAVLNFADREGIRQQGSRDYWRLMGEVEARTVEERRNMAPAQRRAVHPFFSQTMQDFPPHTQIDPRTIPWLGEG